MIEPAWPHPARPVAVELLRLRLALLQPHVTAHGTETDRNVVLVRVVLADGVEGWGECGALSRPTYTAEYTAGAWAVLRDELVPAALAGAPSAVVGHPMAHAALADAALDAGLRSSGRSLADLLGSTGRRVATTTVIGFAPTLDDLLTRVEAASGGVKLKIAPGRDTEPLAAVRGAWPRRWLAADANGAYDPGDEDRLAALDRFDLAYLEQPVAALSALPAVAARLTTPVALDESVDSVDAFRVAAALSGVGVVNVKPGRVGGVAAACEVVRLAAEGGIDAFVGGLLETGVGRATALAVAGLDGCTLPSDLGPSRRYFATDLTDPVEAGENGTLTVPDGPGIGVTPDPERLAAATIERHTLRA